MKTYLVRWMTCTVCLFIVWRMVDFRENSKDYERSTAVNGNNDYNESKHKEDNNNNNNINYNNNNNDSNTDKSKPYRKLKKIIFWNKYYKSNNFKFGLGREPFLKHNCRVNTCYTTNDRKSVADADVIMFHGPQIDSWPDVRRPRQLYVYVQKEPWIEMSDRLMAAYRDVINVTMTYRRDSDVVLPYAIVTRNVSDVDVDVVDPKSRPRSVVWVVSHCETASRREDYVRQLSRHVDVDVYGECGPLTCDKRHNGACWDRFRRKYRFVIAMENRVCRDYVSEKAYRPLNHDLVPIVLGGADYAAVTPPHSVIDVTDFPSPKALADYLNYLSDNATAYNEYFAWKALGYGVETYRRLVIGQSFCRLCELLHDDKFRPSNPTDLREWWVNGACDDDVMTRMASSW